MSVHGEQLRCDVIVDMPSQFQIDTTTQELYLDDSPEEFVIRAKNDKGKSGRVIGWRESSFVFFTWFADFLFFDFLHDFDWYVYFAQCLFIRLLRHKYLSFLHSFVLFYYLCSLKFLYEKIINK